MASSTSCKQQLHAVAIPLPGLGHINPLMRFCRRLASQEGFTITFVDIQLLPHRDLQALDAIPPGLTAKQDHTSMASDFSAPAPPPVAAADGRQQLDIRRVCIPMEIPKMHDGCTLFQCLFEGVRRLSPLFEELLSQLIHADPPITCLISDLYMTGATQKVADKFNIPRIGFHTTSQSVLLFKNYILEGTISLEEVLKVLTRKEALKEETFVEGLMGLPTLTNGDLMDYHEDNVLMYALNLEALVETKERTHAIVLNSMKELEELGLKVNIGGIPIYAVGPLIEPLDKDTGTSLWKEDNDCILWLNEQPCYSVLYISFGSYVALSKAQFEEILNGLISSGQRFLWVFRPNLVEDVSYSSTLHVDLPSRCNGKGYFVQWAPQLMILSHPSVGGFFTHCGWNSTIEAIASGVPMLCFPYLSDQFINARFITQEWKVGLRFAKCKDNGLVQRDEVERVIRALMVEEEGKILQKNAKYFKDISCQALQLEGTSTKNIKALVEYLRQGCLKSTIKKN